MNKSKIRHLVSGPDVVFLYPIKEVNISAMPKKYGFIMLCVVLTSTVLGQQRNLTRFDEIQEGEYTIRILPAPGNTYGYDILKGNKVVVHQLFNHFPKGKRTEGLKTRADVIKVTRYMLQEARKSGRPISPMLPDKIVHDLYITK
jgi:hypothetical protein